MIQDLSINDDEMKIAILALIDMYSPTAYLIAAGYDDNNKIGERTYIDITKAFFFNRLIGIKLSNNSCIELASGDSSNFSIFRCYGSLEERNKMLKDFNVSTTLELIESYMIEVSKEQWYDMVKLPIIDVNKE